MPSPSPSTLTLLVLVPLILWRVYSRFKRLVGRQRLSRIRPWITLTIYGLLITLLCLAARTHPERLAWLAGGLACGAALGVFGIRHTKFKAVPGALYYTPNAHLGIALSLLFVGRIVYRFVEVYLIEPGVPHGLHDFARSSLTLSVFGLLAGYYISYAIGLARWRWGVLLRKRERESSTE